MMQNIHHTAISTGNLDRLVGFYRVIELMELAPT